MTGPGDHNTSLHGILQSLPSVCGIQTDVFLCRWSHRPLLLHGDIFSFLFPLLIQPCWLSLCSQNKLCCSSMCPAFAFVDSPCKMLSNRSWHDSLALAQVSLPRSFPCQLCAKGVAFPQPQSLPNKQLISLLSVYYHLKLLISWFVLTGFTTLFVKLHKSRTLTSSALRSRTLTSSALRRVPST